LSVQCRHWRTASSAHTYRLLVVKEPADSILLPALALPAGPAAAKRCVRQQQRSEIMRRLLLHVNSFLSLRFQKTAVQPCPFLSPAALFCGRGRTITKLSTTPQEAHKGFFSRFSQLISINFFVLFWSNGQIDIPTRGRRSFNDCA